MSKALKSWSGMRKYLEKEMLATSLNGRVRYSCTTFVGMDGCGVFEMLIDDISVKRFSMETVASDLYMGTKPVNMQKYWETFWHEKKYTPLEKRTQFDDVEFSEALEEYRAIDISQALNSINPIVRMFAILDRRVGKRTLKKLKAIAILQPEWLRFFYNLRLSAENVD